MGTVLFRRGWRTDQLLLAFGNGGRLQLIIFPTSGARYYENKDFGLIGAVAWHIDNGNWHLVHVAYKTEGGLPFPSGWEHIYPK